MRRNSSTVRKQLSTRCIGATYSLQARLVARGNSRTLGMGAITPRPNSIGGLRRLKMALAYGPNNPADSETELRTSKYLAEFFEPRSRMFRAEH